MITEVKIADYMPIKITGAFPRNYADIYTGSLAPSTRRAYLKDVLDFFAAKSLTDITIEQIRNVNVATANDYREVLLDRGYKPSTINRKLSALSKFYSFMMRYEVGIMKYNPFSSKEGTSRVRYNKQYTNTRCLTKEEVKSMIDVTYQSDTAEQLRNRVIILLLATTGMRRAELVQIKVGDIVRTQGKDIVEVMGKGGKERIVVISKRIKELIDQYLEMRELSYLNKDEYLLTSHAVNAKAGQGITTQTVYNMIKKVAAQAGIGAEDVHPHCLRHTYITESLDMGCKIEDVQDRVGHADMSTTRRYDHTRRVLKDNPAEAFGDMYLD